MIDLFLKAADEAALRTALIEAGVITESTAPIYELRETGEMQRVVVLENDGERHSMTGEVEASPDYAEMLADGFVVISDGLEPVMQSVQVGERTEYSTAGGFALDIIGVIYKPTGNMLSMGPDDHLEYPETIPVDGYHANLRGELTEDQLAILQPLLITQPANPARVWA